MFRENNVFNVSSFIRVSTIRSSLLGVSVSHFPITRLSSCFRDVSSSLVLKRHYGGKSKNPIKTPLSVSPVREKVITTTVPFSTKNTINSVTVNTPNLPNKPIKLPYQDVNKGFYQHNSIKSTISPYQVVPKEQIPEASNVSSLSRSSKVIPVSSKGNLFERFGFRSFKELLFGPSQVNSTSSMTPDIANTNNNSDASTTSFHKSEMLVVAPSISPSPFCPIGLDKELYFRANLVTAVVFSAKCQMPLEINALNAAYYRENSGQNIQVLQAIAKNAKLTEHMNLLPYLPSNVSGIFPLEVIQDLKRLRLTQLGFATEIRACSQLNESFSIPFIMDRVTVEKDKFNKPIKKEKPKLIDGEIVDGVVTSNNTGQPHPDYFRVIKKSDGTLVKDTYDLKSSISPLKQLDQVRLVSNNLENMLLDVHEQVYNNITLKINSSTVDVVIGKKILNLLDNMKQIYQKDLDIRAFRISYNAIRSDFAEFFITHRIPMNLVVHLGIEDFPIDISDLSFFQQAFCEFYYSPHSPVIKIYSDYLAINNNQIKDYTQFFKYLAERLQKASEF